MGHQLYRHIGNPSMRVVEEYSEVIKAICKAERFGYFNHHPDNPSRNNHDDILSEMNDVIEAFDNFKKHMRENME